MGTRGCVGVMTGKNSWRGVYNHYDSYPTGLGAEVYEVLRGKSDKDLKSFRKEILEFNDWREYLNGGLCEYCGVFGVGQPHSIRGDIATKKYDGAIFPDPEAKYHEHDKSPATIYSKNAKYDALFIEWAYILEKDKNILRVYTHVRKKGMHTETSYDGERSFESPNYGYELVAKIPLDDLRVEVPVDWEVIEKKGRKIGDLAYEKNGG